LQAPGQTTDNEKELLLKIAEGDELAFGKIFNSYYPTLLNFVSRIDQNNENADEAIQETFIRVWISRDKLPEINNFRAWLFTIASREAIALIRKNLLKKKASEIFIRDQPILSSDTPADITQAAELRRLIEQAIAYMPAARRRIYLMSREDGLKPAEIASKLDLSVSTVKNSLVTALHDIRKFLALHGQMMTPLFLALLVY